MKLLKLSTLTALTASLLLGSYSSASALSLGVQFSYQNALASNETAGVISQSNWNIQTAANGPLTSLVWDDGSAATGISYGFSNLFGYRLGSLGNNTTPDQKLMGAEFYGDITDQVLTISGLDDSQKYSFVLYTGMDPANPGTEYVLNVAAGGTTYNVTEQTAGFSTAWDGIYNRSTDTTGAYPVGNYVEFTALSPVGGQLSIDIQGVGTSPHQSGMSLNGFQISADPVPEPSTWAMMAGGLAMLAGTRKFRRRG